MRILYLFILISFSALYANPSQNNNNIYQLLFSGLQKEAALILQEEIKTDSLNVENHYLLGLSRFYQKEYRQALPCFQKTVELDSCHVNGLYYLANTQMNLGLEIETEQSFTKAIQIDSSRTDIKDALGQFYYKNQNFDKSYAVYKDLAGMHPQNPFYYMMLARSASKCDSLQIALKHYRNAFYLDTLNSKVAFELSGTLFIVDSLDASFQFINRALDSQHSNWQCHRLKADILYKQKAYLSAILSYLDGITYGDNSVAALKKLGFCYCSENLYEKCINALEQVLEYEDSDPVVYYYMGLSFKQMDELELAVQYLEEGINCVFPGFMDNLYSTLAECYQLSSNYPEAIRNYRKALEFTNDKEVIYYHLANVYDEYYVDRNVSLEYYEKARQKEITPEITEFIRQKISELKQEIFFNHKESQD